MNSFQVNQVFYVFWCSQWPADMATDPVKRQGFVSTELTGKLEEEQESHQKQKLQVQDSKQKAKQASK